MQALTKQKSRRVRRALLALSDAQLARIVEDWLKSALQAWPINGADDQALFDLGYQLKIIDGDQTYPSWEDFQNDEELELEAIEWVRPTEINWRAKITAMTLPMFYHTVLWAAGEALANTAFAEIWGPSPGEKRSGYMFLDKLADHLVLTHKLSEHNLDRFTYAARRLHILSYRDEESADLLDVATLDAPSVYEDIDAEIERLVHEPGLPYWFRSRQQGHKRKRK
jgi:hypothetical protein